MVGVGSTRITLCQDVEWDFLTPFTKLSVFLYNFVVDRSEIRDRREGSRGTGGGRYVKVSVYGSRPFAYAESASGPRPLQGGRTLISRRLSELSELRWRLLPRRPSGLHVLPARPASPVSPERCPCLLSSLYLFHFCPSLSSVSSPPSASPHSLQSPLTPFPPGGPLWVNQLPLSLRLLDPRLRRLGRVPFFPLHPLLLRGTVNPLHLFTQDGSGVGLFFRVSCTLFPSGPRPVRSTLLVGSDPLYPTRGLTSPDRDLGLPLFDTVGPRPPSALLRSSDPAGPVYGRPRRRTWGGCPPDLPGRRVRKLVRVSRAHQVDPWFRERPRRGGPGVVSGELPLELEPTPE